jgi:putative exporter of polyketide antibiotics
MTLPQYLALFIAAYFASMPLLAFMMPNVTSNYRSLLWTDPKGWLYKVEPYTRLLIAGVTVLCAGLANL